LLTSEGALYRSRAVAATPVWENEHLFGGANVDFFDTPITNIFHGRIGCYISSYDKGFFQRVPGTGVLIPLHTNLKDKTVRTILETSDGALFVGCESGMFKTTDGGGIWNEVREHGMTNKIFSSADNDKTWKRVDAGLLVNPFVSNIEVDLPKAQTIFDLAQAGKYFFCSTEAGIFRSSDRGQNWELIFRNTSKRMLNFAVSGQIIYAIPVAGC